MTRPLSLWIATVVAVASSASAAEKLSYNRDIRPILSENCFSCHGVDAEHRKGDLRLDEPEAAYGEGDSGEIAIVPGKPEESEIWYRITTDDGDDIMPPTKTKKTLSAADKATLKRWIEEGATYQKHWAFEAPVAKAAPEGGFDIDPFLEAEMKAQGLSPRGEADRHTLIRRVAYATTGLPPSPEELEQFLSDTKPGAYERMVDRYLASNHFGEEMARHWLDVARYADTHGMHLDNERQMFAYRDWVVGAFNRNLPFDQFTIEQIAGDLIPDATNDQLVATGFNRCNITTGEGGSIAAEWIYRYAVERASTTAQVWLGLTASCAVCHDHKFDPISTKDFYSFYAFFHSNADPAMDGNKLLTAPVVKVTPTDSDARIQDFEKRIAALRSEMNKLSASVVYKDPAEQTPRAPVAESETIWYDDVFPQGAATNATGHPLTYAKAPEPVFSGATSNKRSGPGISQSFYEGGAAPLTVPAGAKFFFHVYIDPKNPTKEVMIQFNTGAWSHRAYWGANVIPWGKDGTGERFAAGSLPEAGKWVRLEVPAEKMNLKPGAQVKGFAFTIQDGTAYFDKMGIVAKTDPASDPARSFVAWRKSAAGKDTPGAPKNINQWIKEGPDKPRTQNELELLRLHYVQSVCATTKPHFGAVGAKLDAVVKERAAYENSMHSTFVYRDLPKPRKSYVMMRGAYDKPDLEQEVLPDTFEVLPPLKKADPDGRATRLDLAKWLVARDNPLTARVAVNRFWQQLFGVGLVKTSHDFGTQGDLPSHPELLDGLAIWYQDQGWDTKKLVRLMLVSDAFRRDSSAPAELWKADPENRYLARGPRIRLDAEQLRDGALLAGGLLVKTMGGKGVKTYQPPNIWEPVGFRGSNTANYKRDNGDALWRRSIYVFFKRTAPAPFLENFDAPNREASCHRRDRSNTPLQALQLLNDVQFFEAARGLATRMMAAAEDPAGRIGHGYQVVLSRPPADWEQGLVGDYYKKQLAKYQGAPAEAAKAIRFGDSKPPDGVDEVQLAAWTLVANMILNLDETIVRN